MNPKKNLIAFILATAILNSSCKKVADSTNSEEFETTFELSKNQAIGDNLTQDATDVFMEAAGDKNLLGNNILPAPVEPSSTLACATVTVTPAIGFPKNIVIDFGDGTCVAPNGIIRKGKINITLSDSVRKSGSTAVMTFDNYFVNSYKKEGTITWTNTSTPGVRSWKRKVENGKITSPDGKYWLHSGTTDIVQVEGVATPGIIDDAFTLTENHTVTNAAGKTRECSTIEALYKKTICENISKGKIKIQGPEHYAIIDFGDGTCDKIATVSIDGKEPHTVLLR